MSSMEERLWVIMRIWERRESCCKQVQEAAGVGLVQGRVHLVQDAEGGRPDEEQGEQAPPPRSWPFRRRTEGVEVFHLLAGQLHHQMQARVQGVQCPLPGSAWRLAPAEEHLEHTVQAFVHPLQGLQEAAPGGAVDLADGRAQVLQGSLQVGLLAR